MKRWLPLIFAGLVSACAKPVVTPTPVLKDCVLPADQSGTLSGKWRTTPVPVAFSAGQFDAGEQADIVAAANTWNGFMTASQGVALLDYGNAGAPNQSGAAKPSYICSQGIVQGDGYSGQVVIYKQSQWPYSNHSAIALTSFCPVPATPFKNIYMAIMEVNYEDFFSAGKKQPDLQSIFLHEFGHLIGLDHSCNTYPKPGFPTCSDPSLPGDYFSAVMYPVVFFDGSGFGEQRQVLQTNDQGRSNCLYQPQGTSGS